MRKVEGVGLICVNEHYEDLYGKPRNGTYGKQIELWFSARR
jgi:hypothetical protein